MPRIWAWYQCGDGPTHKDGKRKKRHECWNKNTKKKKKKQKKQHKQLKWKWGRLNAFCEYYLFCVLRPTEFVRTVWLVGMRAAKAINRIGRILFSILNFCLWMLKDVCCYCCCCYLSLPSSRSCVVYWLNANKRHYDSKWMELDVIYLYFWSVHFWDSWQRADKNRHQRSVAQRVATR